MGKGTTLQDGSGFDKSPRCSPDPVGRSDERWTGAVAGDANRRQAQKLGTLADLDKQLGQQVTN